MLVRPQEGNSIELVVLNRRFWRPERWHPYLGGSFNHFSFSSLPSGR